MVSGFDLVADGDGDGDGGFAGFDGGGVSADAAASGKAEWDGAAGDGFGDGDDGAESHAGGGGVGFGAGACVFDGALACGFLELFGVAEGELEALEAGGIAGGVEGRVDDGGEAAEVAHADGECVLDEVAGDGGGAWTAVVVLRGDGDGPGLDVAIGDAVRLDGLDEAIGCSRGALAGVGDGCGGDFDGEVEDGHVGRGAGLAGAADGDAVFHGGFSCEDGGIGAEAPSEEQGAEEGSYERGEPCVAVGHVFRLRVISTAPRARSAARAKAPAASRERGGRDSLAGAGEPAAVVATGASLPVALPPVCSLGLPGAAASGGGAALVSGSGAAGTSSGASVAPAPKAPPVGGEATPAWGVGAAGRSVGAASGAERAPASGASVLMSVGPALVSRAALEM